MTGATRDDGSLSSPDLVTRLIADAAETARPWGIEARDRELFLFVYLFDLARLGVFVPTREPAPVGADLDLSLASRQGDTLWLRGRVQWVNPPRSPGEDLNPGMGVMLSSVSAELRERLVEEIRTIAYLR